MSAMERVKSEAVNLLRDALFGVFLFAVVVVVTIVSVKGAQFIYAMF
ncbi:MAG: hypothetical protein M5R36_11470 [Deltaproteobacteria bacterium]|nr:hypothetical protein [Deltaproteobacteria bacterium]